MSEWQKIETAPKDGTRIIVWRDHGLHLMWWNVRKDDGGGFWDEWHVGARHLSIQPTHWMLPSPPGDEPMSEPSVCEICGRGPAPEYGGETVYRQSVVGSPNPIWRCREHRHTDAEPDVQAIVDTLESGKPSSR